MYVYQFFDETVSWTFVFFCLRMLHVVTGQATCLRLWAYIMCGTIGEYYIFFTLVSPKLNILVSRMCQHFQRLIFFVI